MCSMRSVRSIVFVLSQWGLALALSLAGVEERPQCGLALARRLIGSRWRLVRPLSERLRSPVLPGRLAG